MMTTSVMEPPAAPPRIAASGKYLTFKLTEEEYAIEVLKVREIMGVQHITAVPQTPQSIKGVINLRGKVVPVVDLRLRFGLPDTEYTARTCIIVVQINTTETLQMGIVVDEVCEVLNLSDADLQETPNFGQGISTPYLLGMAKVKGKVKILLDIDHVLASEDASGLHEMLRDHYSEQVTQ